LCAVGTGSALSALPVSAAQQRRTPYGSHGWGHYVCSWPTCAISRDSYRLVVTHHLSSPRLRAPHTTHNHAPRTDPPRALRVHRRGRGGAGKPREVRIPLVGSFIVDAETLARRSQDQPEVAAPLDDAVLDFPLSLEHIPSVSDLDIALE
jgi:hypothetical protein